MDYICPVPRKRKKNTVIEKLLLEDFAAEGRSLGHWSGKVVFVERTMPGDVADIFLFKNKRDWAEGYPLKIHEYSPRRVEPFCQHFGDCGGCQWQMVRYEEQLQFKQQQVYDALHRIGKIDLPDFLPILGAADDKFYRNKLEYTFGTMRYVPEKEFQKNKTALKEIENTSPSPWESASEGEAGAAGFHARGLFDKVVDIEKCYLQAEPSNAIRESIRVYASNNDLTFYDVRHHTGFLRNVQLRICTTGETMANVIVGEAGEDKIRGLLDHLLQTVPGITTLLYTINQKKNDSLYDLQPVVYSGKGYVMEKLGAFKFRIGPTSFFQTNSKQTERLYDVVREFATLNGKEIVYDLYCGAGSIGIYLSRQAGKIIGVELIEAAVKDAKENAAINQAGNCSFFSGDVLKICDDDFFAGNGKPDVVVTDPPRAGMHPGLVKKLLEMEAPLLVYVSCNPATQARDLNVLGEKYEVTAVQPVDMFPHTHHIENVVRLKLKTP